jgi:hypothetical protein
MNVKIWTCAPLLLSILAILSLMIAPMVVPSAAAMTTQPAGMEDMAGMADGMPCPSQPKQPLPDCEKSCPLAALCTAKCFPSTPAVGESGLAFFATVAQLPSWNDDTRDRLSDPPPSRPPRT